MTYTELQDYVRERLGIPTSDTSRVTQIQRLLNAHYFQTASEAETTLSTTTLTFTIAVATVALGASVEKVKAIVTATGRLEPVSPARFAFYAGSFFTTDLPAAPRYYIVTRGATSLVLRLWPTPTATDATPIAFVLTRPTAMAAAGDSPSDVPEAWHHLIAERVVRDIALAEEQVDLAREALLNVQEWMGSLVQHIRERDGELLGAIDATADLGLGMAALLGQEGRQ